MYNLYSKYYELQNYQFELFYLCRFSGNELLINEDKQLNNLICFYLDGSFINNSLPENRHK